jgi:ankyrin repeat protein
MRAHLPQVPWIGVSPRPNVAARPPLDTRDAVGGTALHVAAAVGAHQCVERLVQIDAVGTLLGLGDDEGARPLHLAAAGGHPTCVKALLAAHAQHGVSADLHDHDGTCGRRHPNMARSYGLTQQRQAH